MIKIEGKLSNEADHLSVDDFYREILIGELLNVMDNYYHKDASNITHDERSRIETGLRNVLLNFS
jgi:hypothetical protein